MKQILTKLLILPLLLALTFSLSACDGGIDTDAAKLHIEKFLTALSTEDYEAAASYLHPERPADLEKYCTAIEEREGVDIFDRILIEKYTGYHYSYYDSSVDGSAYEVTIRAKIGDTPAELTVEVVENDAGYGIYNFDMDFE